MARGKQITKQLNKSTSECLQLYLRHCMIKNLSDLTLKTYRIEGNTFIEWYGTDKGISGITTDTIEDYIIFIKSKNISETYIATKIRHVRAFLYFCMERDYLPSFKITVPKADEVIKDPYTNKELERLLKKPQSRNFVEWRSWALLNYLLSTGNRISTALALRISDVDFHDSMITLKKTKSRKAQYIPMSTGLKKVLNEYLSLWDHTDDDFLFPEYEGGQLSVGGAYSATKRYRIERGITKTSNHLFRNTYAKNYITAGGDSLYLQRLLGHSTLTMTNHYLRLYSTDLKKNYDKFNPLDNLSKAN